MRCNLRQAGLIILVTALLSACGGGGGGGDEGAATGSASAPEVSTSIGPAGGSLEVTDTASKLYGARIDVPPGALASEQEITMQPAKGSGNLPPSYFVSGLPVTFGPTGLVFLKPVTIVLPYHDRDNDGYIDGTDRPEAEAGALYADLVRPRWEIIQVLDQDLQQNLVTFEVSHFSTYLVFIDQTIIPDPVDGTDPVPVFLSGEHVTAPPLFSYDSAGNRQIFVQQTPFHYLSVLNWPEGLTAKVDLFLTMTRTGYPCVISSDSMSCTFDPAGFFAKVQQSGDATLWDWQCEFVPEYTSLLHYEVRDDALQDVGGGGISCVMTAIDATTVQITWGVDASQEVFYSSSDGSVGSMLAIRIWANYL